MSSDTNPNLVLGSWRANSLQFKVTPLYQPVKAGPPTTIIYMMSQPDAD